MSRIIVLMAALAAGACADDASIAGLTGKKAAGGGGTAGKPPKGGVYDPGAGLPVAASGFFLGIAALQSETVQKTWVQELVAETPELRVSFETIDR